jgi:uncharacterized membrane protein
MSDRAINAERRWPMAVAVLGAVVLQVVTPHRGRLAGWWLLPVLEVALLVIIIVQDPHRIDATSKAARRTTVTLIAVMTVGTLTSVAILLFDIVTGDLPSFVASGSALNATNLLGRGAALWVTNVIVFSLWFWEYDRGGPVARAFGGEGAPAFAFPENAMPDLARQGWIPQYADYLYLSFTNATAFSPTDTLPVRLWAKMTMMGQSMLSLLIAILVVARAINIL